MDDQPEVKIRTRFGAFHSDEIPSLGWRWKQHVTPKRWYPTTSLYGVTPQKTTSWL